VISLLVDAAIAVVVLTDRGLCAVERSVRRLRPFSPAVVGDARPADAGSPPDTGIGGHPIRSTSALLGNAAIELSYAYQDLPAIIAVLIAELSDRAAQLRAVGD